MKLSLVLLANITCLTTTGLTGLVGHTGTASLGGTAHLASVLGFRSLLALGLFGVFGLGVFLSAGFLLLGRFFALFAPGFAVAALSGVFVVRLFVAHSIIVVAPTFALNFRLLFALFVAPFASLATNFGALFMRLVRVGVACLGRNILLNRPNRLGGR